MSSDGIGVAGSSSAAVAARPTFACRWPDCGRVYKKADHLERHERTHTGEKRYTCRICGKRYARSDVLSRHMVIHGEAPAGQGRPRKTSCLPCLDAKARCDGASPRACSRCLAEGRGSACQYPPESSRSANGSGSGGSHGHGSGPTAEDLPFEEMSRRRRASERTVYSEMEGEGEGGSEVTSSGGTEVEAGRVMPEQTIQPPLDPLLHAPALPPDLDSQLALLANTAADWQTHDLFSLAGPTLPGAFTNGTGAGDWSGVQGMGGYDWPFLGSELDFGGGGEAFEALNSQAPGTPSFNLLGGWAAGFDGVQAVPQVQTQAQAVKMEAIDLGEGETQVEADLLASEGPPHEVPDGQPPDSPWPHVYKPTTPDARVDVPPERPILVPPPLSVAGHVSPSARRAMILLIDHSHRGIWPPVDVGNFPSTQTLTITLNLYFRHFNDWLPVFDAASFSLAKTQPILLMAMVPLGATYSRDGLQSLGIALNELVRRALLFIREHDQRHNFDTHLVQSSLLQVYFGLFCGSQKLFQQGESERGHLVTACKRAHLLRPGRSAVDELLACRPSFSADDMANAVAEDDRRRRLGWGIYLLDAQLACLLNLPAQLSLAEVVAPLPSQSMLHDHQQDRSDGRNMFAQVVGGMLTDGEIPHDLDDLGYSILAHTLYRMCLDAAITETLVPVHRPGHQYKLQFTASIRHNPQILLDRLSVSTFHTSVSPTPLLLSCAALAYHSHMNFTRIGLINEAKVAAGKSGSNESKQAARASISQWVRSDPGGCRNVVAHAGMLASLLHRFRFDSPPEVIWTFDAAIILWAVLRSGQVLAHPEQPPRATISWSPSPQVDDWVRTGGNVMLQGIGELATITPKGVLRLFAQRLDGLSWGLASRYKRVLLNLMEEP